MMNLRTYELPALTLSEMLKEYRETRNVAVQLDTNGKVPISFFNQASFLIESEIPYKHLDQALRWAITQMKKSGTKIFIMKYAGYFFFISDDLSQFDLSSLSFLNPAVPKKYRREISGQLSIPLTSF